MATKALTPVQRASRAVGALLSGKPIREAAMAAADPDDDLTASQGGSAYFTPITKDKRRDLAPYDHDRMVQIAAHLMSRNPLAKKIVNARVNYVLGEGATVSAVNEQVQAVIDRFWKDGFNRVQRRQPSWLRSLRGYGELCLTATTNPVNGRVRLGYVAPDAIKDVEHTPGNPHDTTKVTLKQRTDAGDAISFEPARLVEDPNDEAYGRMRGNCLLFAANRLPDQARGTSDLFAIADYIDAYESVTWDLVDRAGLINSLLWHVILEGYTPEQVQDWWDKNAPGGKPPRAATVVATNEKVSWNALTPDFAGADAAAWADLILAIIATGADLPKMWLNAQDDPNRASAESLAGPSFKSLSEVQNEWRDVITDVVQFVIDQAVLTGALPDGLDETFSVNLPEMSERILGDIATALSQVAMSLSSLREDGLLDRETSLQIVAMMVDRLGVSIDADTLRERIESEGAGEVAGAGATGSVYDRVPSPFGKPDDSVDVGAVLPVGDGTVPIPADATAAVTDGAVADAAAMSAAKVAVLVGYAKDVRTGALGREEAIAQIEYTFNVSAEQAAKFVGSGAVAEAMALIRESEARPQATLVSWPPNGRGHR